MGVFRDLLRFKPLDVGAEAPPLSLTADEGTWIKLRDFKGQLNVLFIFFQEESDATGAFLKAVEGVRPQLEKLETAVFGVHTARTDRLRDFRSHLGLGFFLIYDPLALTARAFGASRRVRPLCRDTVVLVDKDQKVAFLQQGWPDVNELVRTVARIQGAAVPEPEVHRKPGDPVKASAAVRDIDSKKAVELLEAGGYKLVDVRTKSEYDADHAPMAVLIPVDELPHRYQDLKQSEKLIFVCQAGDRSAAASEFMTSIGSNEIYNVIGGMSSWTGPREATVVK